MLTVPDDMTVDATGLFTKVELGVASAEDASGQSLPVFLTEGNNVFAPGVHTVLWQTEDSYGTTTTEAQTVEVNPLISLGDSRTVSEGITVALPLSSTVMLLRILSLFITASRARPAAKGLITMRPVAVSPSPKDVRCYCPLRSSQTMT